MISRTGNLTQQPILIIDDDANVIRALTQVLRKEFHVVTTTSAVEGLQYAKHSPPLLALVDFRMSEASGLDVLKDLKRIAPECIVMMMTAYSEVSVVIEAFKLGAIDFLIKPFDNRVLLESVRRLAALSNAEKESLQQQVNEIVGESEAIKHVWSLVRRFAPEDIPIILTGETGTGKELFAKVIHGMSRRNRGPFVPADCSTFPASLIESELFGYDKGAFTGATVGKEGLIESANGGTLFLDEIGNLPLPIQAKLLRVTQDHTITHLGSKKRKPVVIDFRIIAATNVDLEESIQDGNFRQDLYYRLSVAAIILPPLRERKGDIPRLVNCFLDRCNRKFKKTIEITEEAMSLLDSYQWPGNIRELENVVRSSYMVADDFIHPRHILNKNIIGTKVIPTPSGAPIAVDSRELYYRRSKDFKAIGNIASEDAERYAILQIMEQRPFINKTQLARLLKIDPKTLRSKLKKYGLTLD